MSEPVATPPKEPPLTDPADVWRLVGRFFCTLVLSFVAASYLLRRDSVGAGVFAIAALISQAMTIRLWRHLSARRAAAQKERGESQP
jgi:hypothetical protein